MWLQSWAKRDAPPSGMKWHTTLWYCNPDETMNQSLSVKFQNIDSTSQLWSERYTAIPHEVTLYVCKMFAKWGYDLEPERVISKQCHIWADARARQRRSKLIYILFFENLRQLMRGTRVHASTFITLNVTVYWAEQRGMLRRYAWSYIYILIL